jgi:hypothetical protein
MLLTAAFLGRPSGLPGVAVVTPAKKIEARD